MFGELIGAAFGLAGDKPKVPSLPEINVQEQQAKAIAGNQSNLAAARGLASSVNTFNQEEILRMLRAAIPGYDSITGKAGSVINDQLSGNLPADVQNLIQSKAAAKALAGGYAGSGMADNLGLRDLGLTSLQMTQQGLNSAAQWLQTMKSTAVPPQFNVASMFISPSEQLAFAERDRAAKFDQQWLSNQIKAMPSPLEQAGMNALKNFDQLTWTAAGSFAGGALGGLGGGMAGGGSQFGSPMSNSFGVADINPNSYGAARSKLGL